MRLPAADAHQPPEPALQIAAQQFEEQHGRAGRYSMREASGVPQGLHSAFVFGTVRAPAPASFRSGLPPDARAAILRKQAELMELKLRRQVYATVAGLLKWQLPWQLKGRQRQLLEWGSLAQLQVERQDRDQALAAKPTMGMGKMAEMGLASRG